MQVLLTGLYKHGTGLTNVLLALADNLQRHHTVDVIGFSGDPHLGELNSPLADNIVLSPSRGWYFSIETSRLEEKLRKCDVVILCGSLFCNEHLLRRISASRYRDRFRVIMYLPVEGLPTSPRILESIGLADCCAFYGQYALLAVQKLIAERLSHDPAYKQPILARIGHGIDQAQFSQLKLRDKPQTLLHQRQRFWTTSDVREIAVLSVARPYVRKRLDISIAGFGIAARQCPSLKLVLHPGPLAQNQRNELDEVIGASGVSDRITILGDGPLGPEDMNLLYNVCDIGLSTSSGEGWGMPPFEHGLTGAPQIVPDHTIFRENWNVAATMLKVRESQDVFYEYSTMFSTSPTDVAEALLSLTDPQTRQSFGEKARLTAASGSMSWKNVSDRIEGLIKSLP